MKGKTEQGIEWCLWTQVLKEEKFFNSMGVSRIYLFFHFCWQLLLYSEKTLIFALMKVPLFFSFKK